MRHGFFRRKFLVFAEKILWDKIREEKQQK